MENSIEGFDFESPQVADVKQILAAFNRDYPHDFVEVCANGYGLFYEYNTPESPAVNGWIDKLAGATWNNQGFLVSVIFTGHFGLELGNSALLHECLHQYFHQRTGDGDSHHLSPKWSDIRDVEKSFMMWYGMSKDWHKDNGDYVYEEDVDLPSEQNIPRPDQFPTTARKAESSDSEDGQEAR